MSTQHTPAPWEIDRDQELWIKGGVNHPVCMVTGNVPTERDLADARLIAAAPDMLTALKAAAALAVCCAAEDNYSREELVEAGRTMMRNFDAIIAKATTP